MLMRPAAWLLLAVGLWPSCAKETLPGLPDDPVRNGYVRIDFGMDVPDMTEVTTRAVDPDASGVEDIRLFCFDGNGLFISTATVSGHTPDPGSDYALSGRFSAEVVDYTRIVHIIANQNLDDFSEMDYLGMPEDRVMTALTASSGRMIYWGRVEATERETIAEAMKAETVPMVRNQARIGVNGNGHFMLSGFAVCNTSAFGTMVPYNRKTARFDWFEVPEEEKYVTLPAEPGRVSGIEEVNTAGYEYVFESENLLSDPVSVILYGRNANGGTDAYYRVLLLDNRTQEPLPILRNHAYTIRADGPLSYPYPTFAEALNGAATNNVWISVSDDIHSVMDGEYVLSVDQTSVVVLGSENAGIPHEIGYSYTAKGGGGVPAEEAPEVNWVSGSNDVAHPLISKEYDPQTGEGTVNLSLLPMNGREKREGTLLIKKGKLQRTVKIITIGEQTFTPCWISTEVFNEANQHVTLMFNIPESCPEELFPFDVLISINHIDVRAESGMTLQTVTRISDPDRYGEDVNDRDGNPIGYKYVYPVERPGVQRVYFRTVLDDEPEDKVTLEADYFQTLSKTYTFNETRYSLYVEGLSEYDGSGNPDEDTGYAEDEAILYRMVPQKIRAQVNFDLATYDGTSLMNGSPDDEFLIYSQYLSDYPENEIPGATAQCRFVAVDEASWGTGGRLYGFYPLVPGGQRYTIYMYTNTPASAEVVRIASNHPASPSVKGSGDYTGNTYRSVTFELANYAPFRFKSALNGDASGAQSWSYRYGQPADVAFDITAFTAADGQTPDPFGTSFRVFIDAPMLEIDEARRPGWLSKDKFYADPSTPGRFVYVVNASRDAEADRWTLTPADEPAARPGERKVLPFRTAEIVSAGQIVISADPEIVVFDTETYTITNEPIAGSIRYGAGNAPVPANAFVSFERSRDGTRIGSVAVKTDGSYELRLRSEYDYAWGGDERVEFRYTDTAGTTYVCPSDNLAALFAQPDITLTAE